MIDGRLEHLVLVRHGESEGDVRRAANKTGYPTPAVKDTLHEEQTPRGERQSMLAGRWITEHILRAYRLPAFDSYLDSPLIRTRQSAIALGLRQAQWREEILLAERDRGAIRGMTKSLHQSRYTDNYAEMNRDPLHWTPPQGESIRRVAERAGQLLSNISLVTSAVLVTHRDWIWAAHAKLEDLADETLSTLDTDAIQNGQVIHYTSVDPVTGMVTDALRWKRSVCPWIENTDGVWVELQREPAALINGS
jgi:broad specificity phosphatase PhoE